MISILRFLLLISLLTFQQARAQHPYPLNYTIKVELDTANHMLHGFLQLAYFNDTPDTLSYLFFHLWPNAYAGRNSAYARQNQSIGDAGFYFSKSASWGNMDSLHFKQEDVELQYGYLDAHPDIVKVILAKPIAPGTKSTFSTPFRVKIPETFSRLGRAGKSYQITQWYPKPAVVKGKHIQYPMPYLDQGEFYSAFGAFEVEITVPAGYVVAATGNCNSPEEADFLQQVLKGQHASEAQGKRTFTYTLDSIHDFAWFADPDFVLCEKEFTLKSGKRITARAFYLEKHKKHWQYACDYVERSIRWYSDCVGEYPYNIATAVDGALSAGGGMEYPTITIIGSVGDTTDLEEVILHEVGHNWFYGILASNERLFPWMDEGINSYYEHRYMKQKRMHQKKDSSSMLSADQKGIQFQLDAETLTEWGWRHLARTGQVLAHGLPASHYTQLGYGIIIYGYASRWMEYLEAYLGTPAFDQAMQYYYKTRAFQHPQPQDFKKSLEESIGKNLDFFFADVLWSPQFTVDTTEIAKSQTPPKSLRPSMPDFSLHRLRSEASYFHIRNHARNALPAEIAWMQKDSVVFTTWTQPFTGKLRVENTYSGSFDKIRVNASGAMPEVNIKNNTIYNRSFLPKFRTPKLGFLPLGESDDRLNCYALPVIGANSYDGLLAGVWFSNQILPAPRFRFMIMPMYGFRSGVMNGSLYLHKDFLPDYSSIQKIRLAFVQDAYAGMWRMRPEMSITSRSLYQPRSERFSPEWEARIAWNRVWVQYPDYAQFPNVYGIAEAGLLLSHADKVRTWKLSSGIKWYPGHFNLWENEARASLKYTRQLKFSMRAYSGYFLNRNQVGFPFRLFFAGSTDYLMQQVFLDRAGKTDYYQPQLHQTDGNMGGFGAYSPLSTNQWLCALHLRNSIPYTPLFVFSNIGTMAFMPDTKLLYDVGIGVEIIPEIWEIYFPLMGNMFSNQWADFKNYGNQIRFMIRLNALTPDRLLRKLK